MEGDEGDGENEGKDGEEDAWDVRWGTTWKFGIKSVIMGDSSEF